MKADDRARLQERIAAFLSKMPVGVSLCAVVKARLPEEVSVAIRAGVRVLGSNYAQETLEIRASIEDETGPPAIPVIWRFIGHLQSNKIRDLLPVVHSVDTLDRLKIAAALNRRAGELGRIFPVLVEVNSGREPQKSGVLPEALPEFVASLSAFANLQIQGLMTMGPAGLGGDGLRPFFALTHRCFEDLASIHQENLSPTVLSMGMSDSWEAAIAEGSNLVRIGTALFGERLKA